MASRVAYMKSTFEGRAYPEAIILPGAEVGGETLEEIIAGPFCVHCGNPLSLHGPTLKCPNRVLHPLFPGPSCACHGERGRD